MPACHAGGRGFEPLLGRQYASVAQMVEQETENLRVGSASLSRGTTDTFASLVASEVSRVFKVIARGELRKPY